MRYSTHFVILAFTIIAATFASEQLMPIVFVSNSIKNLEKHKNVFLQKEEIMTQLAAQITESKEGAKVVVFNINTPFELVQTVSFIKENSKKVPLLWNIFKNNFSSLQKYDPTTVAKDLEDILIKHNIQVELGEKSIKPNTVTIQEISVDLENVVQIEKVMSKIMEENQKSENISVFITFNDNAAVKPPPSKQVPTGRALQEAIAFKPTMLDIPSQTLFALVLLFLLFIPLLYIGISSLYGIQTPEKFASSNLVVGREY